MRKTWVVWMFVLGVWVLGLAGGFLWGREFAPPVPACIVGELRRSTERGAMEVCVGVGSGESRWMIYPLPLYHYVWVSSFIACHAELDRASCLLLADLERPLLSWTADRHRRGQKGAE